MTKANQLKIDLVRNNSVIKLTVASRVFNELLKGKELLSIRTQKDWMYRKLYHPDGKVKDYDYVLCTNGFGHEKPFIMAKFEGHYITDYTPAHTLFENEGQVSTRTGVYSIIIKDIVCQGNYS